MASTYTLTRVSNYCGQFVRRIPLTFTNNNDPAMMIGDWVRNMILQPPFAWRWNRSLVPPITCVVGQTDYQVNLPTFGWIEKATVFNSTSDQAFALSVAMNLDQEVIENRPMSISPYLDDNNGNITFRLSPAPDQAYTLNIIAQNASPKFGTLNDTFAPIPDYFQNIIQQGFLAKTYEYAGDERFAAASQLFVRSLVAANGGLTQTQVNIFMADQLSTAITQANGMQTSQAATQSRDLL